MVEHQSSLNENMPLRFLLYYAELLKIYIAQNNLNVFAKKAVSIPNPEFYMVYNGQDELLSLDLSINRSLAKPSKFIDLNVNLININYNMLPAEIKQRKDVLDGYSYFIDRIRYHQNSKTLQQSVEQAKHDTLNKGYLLDYLKRKEFITMVTKVLTIEEEIELVRQEERQEGIAQGIAQGMAQGVAKGMAQGVAKGKALTVIELLTDGEISYDKAKQKLDKLRASAPNADFWESIYTSLNELKPNPSVFNDSTTKYETKP